MNLYEIDSRIAEAFEAAIDCDTGEIDNIEAFEALNGLQVAFDEKAEGILLWIKNLRAEAEALKQEKLAFAARQSSAEKKAESLERYISGVLNGRKFATEKVSVTWRKSTVVLYDGDAKELPAAYVKQKEPEIDKSALKRALQGGVVIPGALLETRNNIQIK